MSFSACGAPHGRLLALSGGVARDDFRRNWSADDFVSLSQVCSIIGGAGAITGRGVSGGRRKGSVSTGVARCCWSSCSILLWW
jgi:hypothetical protein